MDEKLLQLWNNFRTLHRVMLCRFQSELVKDGLSPAQSEALFIIFKKMHPIGPGQLANWLHMTPGAVSQLLDGLEQSGYINRVRSEADRRQMLVSLSENGAKRIKEIKTRQIKMIHELQKELGEDEIDRMVKAQEKIINYFELEIKEK